MLEEELKKELNILKIEAAPLKLKLKQIEKKIKIIKEKIQTEEDNIKYNDFDPILKKYYTFELPNKKGQDWTYLTGWHGENTSEMAKKIEEMFDGYEPERYQTFSVNETIFEYGLLEEFLDGIDENIINRLNLYSEEPELKNFDGIDEESKNRIIDFIERYTSIKVNSCVHDW